MGVKLTKEEYVKFAIENQIKHFKFEEFVKEEGGFIDSDLVLMLDMLRDAVGFPIIITSGYRSEQRNIEVGGAKRSYHLKGEAVDIATGHLAPSDVYKLLKYAFMIGFKGIIVYPQHLHLDIRPLEFFGIGSYNK
jgi:uncharacterized protein YcbK (DUF882 family)